MYETNKSMKRVYPETSKVANPHQGTLYASDEYVQWLIDNRRMTIKSARQYPKRVLDAAYFCWDDGITLLSSLEEIWEAYENIEGRTLAEAVADQHCAVLQLKNQCNVVNWLRDMARMNGDNVSDEENFSYKTYADWATALKHYCDFLQFKIHKLICEELHIDPDKLHGNHGKDILVLELVSDMRDVMKSTYNLPYSNYEVEAVQKLLHKLSIDYGKLPVAQDERRFKEYLIDTYNDLYAAKFLTKFRNINRKFLNRVYDDGTPLRADVPLPDTLISLHELRDDIFARIEREIENQRQGNSSFSDFNRVNELVEGKKAVKFYFDFIEQIESKRRI